MTTTALKTTEPGFPSEADRDAAVAASRALSRLNGRGCVQVEAVADHDEKQTFILPAEAVRLLTDVLTHLGEGQSVSIMPSDAELTTQQAADMLNVSRPHVVSLIQRSVIPHQMVGTHRRIRMSDLVAYKDARDAKAQTALAALVGEAQELDMGY